MREPYTDEQIRQYADAIEVNEYAARGDLQRLANHGITVDIPKPRFYARSLTGRSSAWAVHERGQAGWKVKFCALEGEWNEREAKALAARLSGEADK